MGSRAIWRGWRGVLVAASLVLPAAGAADEGQGPAELGRRLREASARVRDSVVAVGIAGGTASGVVVSADGWVLTAGHVVAGSEEGKRAKLSFDDGRAAEAEVIGWDLSSDLGLLRIVDGGEVEWPAAELGERSPAPGGYCFTLAHPSGRLEGRPAQLRLGRVRVRLGDENPSILISDCEIQPGDSGGPLFDLDGRLVGIDSSAAEVPGFNQFALIERYHAGRERMQEGGRWGDRKDGPACEGGLNLSLTEETIIDLSEEMQKRLAAGHRPTMRFVEAAHDGSGEVKITPRELAGLMAVEAVALARGSVPHIGLDDPVLVERLPAEAGCAVPPVEVRSAGRPATLGCAVGPKRLLAKRSELDGDDLSARWLGKSVALRRVAEDKRWDLVLLESVGDADWPAIEWPAEPPMIDAGEVLVALDSSGHLLWNVATDGTRPVTKKRSIGPLRDGSLVSGRRAPYPTAIRHALPLYAADAGTPVFDLGGRFIGMHAARFSRTMGLIIPADVLRERVARMERGAGSGERGTRKAERGEPSGVY